MSELDMAVAKYKATKALLNYNKAADKAALLKRSRYSSLEEYLEAQKAEEAAKNKLAVYELAYGRRVVCA